MMEEKTGEEGMSRKEKRKAMKKMKRKQTRKEAAEREREEEEAQLNDPEEQRRIQLLEQEEVERMERERILFEERERAWMERIQQQQQKDQIGDDIDDDEYEYVEEEGPPQIIWQGNEIIVKKKQVRARVRDTDCSKENNQNQDKEGDNRPTSNPFPPELYTETLENVAQQVPNFGTEQDKAHCPFHLKTGACRFGVRCSRVHFYPDKSCTLLIKNMYNGPGLAWDQDEGLERFIATFILEEAHGFALAWFKLKILAVYTDEEVERCFEEFYDDVHTEFLKFGEIVNFKVCKNGSFHLRGNVYVQYKLLDSALLAYNSINGRYFAGKQVFCQFVNLTRWKVAICGEYMKSGFKTCSHGTACNFIHCFRNPGGDYEWADSDKPPPKYWVKKMIALFGYSDDYETLWEPGNLSLPKNTDLSKTDSDRNHSRRSKSGEMDQLNYDRSGRRKQEDEKKLRTPHEERSTNFKDNHKRKCRGRTPDTDSDREWLDKEEDRESCHELTRNSSFKRNKDGNSRSREKDSDVDWETKESEKQHSGEGRNLRKKNRDSRDRIYEAETNGDRDRKTHYISKRKSSRHQSGDDSKSDKDLLDRGDMETQYDSLRKSSRHRRSGLQDDYKYYDNESDKPDGGWSRWESDKREHHHKKKRSKH